MSAHWSGPAGSCWEAWQVEWTVVTYLVMTVGCHQRGICTNCCEKEGFLYETGILQDEHAIWKAGFCFEGRCCEARGKGHNLLRQLLDQKSMSPFLTTLHSSALMSIGPFSLGHNCVSSVMPSRKTHRTMYWSCGDLPLWSFSVVVVVTLLSCLLLGGFPGSVLALCLILNPLVITECKQFCRPSVSWFATATNSRWLTVVLPTWICVRVSLFLLHLLSSTCCVLQPYQSGYTAPFPTREIEVSIQLYFKFLNSLCCICSAEVFAVG